MTTATTHDTATHDTANLLEEELMSIPAAMAVVTGRRPSPTTGWRYRTVGRQGIRLETVVVLGRVCTSPAACKRWLTAVEAARKDAQAATRDGDAGERSEATSRKLAEAGLL